MLGACQAQVPRPVPGAPVTGGGGSTGAHCAALRDRERDPWQVACGTKRGASVAIRTLARIAARMAEGEFGEAVAEVGCGGCDRLCDGTVGSVGALLRRRADRNG